MGIVRVFRKYFYRIRRRCWEIIDEKYPEEKSKYSFIKDLIATSVKDGCVILDAGCGHWSNLPGNLGQTVIIGIDRVLEDVKVNKVLDLGLCSDINYIPLKNESVDLVVCNMVFEHLKSPEVVFRELSRVLKKEGCLIFMTPSVYNIVTLVNMLIPNRFHKKLGNLLTGVSESDVFPTFYRANSIRRLRKLLGKESLIERDLIMYQPPPYAFVFSIVVCKLVIRYYHFINKYDSLRSLRGVIVSRYQKI